MIANCKIVLAVALMIATSSPTMAAGDAGATYTVYYAISCAPFTGSSGVRHHGCGGVQEYTRLSDCEWYRRRASYPGLEIHCYAKEVPSLRRVD